MKKSEQIIFAICLAIILLTIVIVIVSFVFGQNSEYIAEIDYHWIETKLDDDNLIIYGSLADSAYVVTKYLVEEEGDIMYLSIYQSFNAKQEHATSDIYYSYFIPEYINKVYLKGAGNTLKQLWSR